MNWSILTWLHFLLFRSAAERSLWKGVVFVLVMESVSITVILLAVAFLFLRAKRALYAKSVLPLMIVPLAHSAGHPISYFLASFFPLDRIQVFLVVDILALIISCVLLGVFAGKFHNKTSRLVYLVSGCAFVLILSLVFIFHVLTLP